jgi:hypothetical protein
MGSATVLIHGMPASRWTPSGDLSACCAVLGMPALAATRTVFIGGPAAQMLPFAPLLFPQEDPLSCGPAVARMVIASETGRLVPESQLRQQSQKYPGGYDPINGTGMSNVAILLQENGVSDVRMHDDLSIDELQAATAGGHPAIAHCVNEDGSGHFLVVDDVRDNPDGTRTVSGRDPWEPGEGARYQLSEAEFADYYSGRAVTTNP